MISLSSPYGTTILPLPTRRVQFDHVCKHLYRRRERWDLAITGLPQHLKTRAENNGCKGFRTLSYGTASEDCKNHVLRDHHEWYGPAYMNAIFTALENGLWGLWSVGKYQGKQHAFVGQNGIFVISKRQSLSGMGEENVATAYRVIPSGVIENEATPEDFFNEAVRKLQDKTSFMTGSTE